MDVRVLTEFWVSIEVLHTEVFLGYKNSYQPTQQTQKRQPVQRLHPVCSFDPHDILLNSSDDVTPDIVRFIHTAF